MIYSLRMLNFVLKGGLEYLAQVHEHNILLFVAKRKIRVCVCSLLEIWVWPEQRHVLIDEPVWVEVHIRKGYSYKKVFIPKGRYFEDIIPKSRYSEIWNKDPLG